ncbi:hypothetical protein B7486_00180 [cyanobacterium TDX16]|nr:hypothetical protein B7486_00180 [cyanobacterium TDX16]
MTIGEKRLNGRSQLVRRACVGVMRAKGEKGAKGSRGNARAVTQGDAGPGWWAVAKRRAALLLARKCCRIEGDI